MIKATKIPSQTPQRQGTDHLVEKPKHKMDRVKFDKDNIRCQIEQQNNPMTYEDNFPISCQDYIRRLRFDKTDPKRYHLALNDLDNLHAKTQSKGQNNDLDNSSTNKGQSHQLQVTQVDPFQFTDRDVDEWRQRFTKTIEQRKQFKQLKRDKFGVDVGKYTNKNANIVAHAGHDHSSAGKNKF